MMKINTLLLAVFLSLFSATAMAGSDHDHGHSHEPATQEMATTNATKVVASLVERNKLDESWASVTASSIKQAMFKGHPEWVAVFVNDTIADTDKRTLYVFLTLGGEYIAANFTGH